MFLFFSCEKDVVPEERSADVSEKRGIVQVVDKKEITDNEKLTIALNQYKKTSDGKVDFPFKIYDEGAMYIEYKDYHSYSFYIEMNEPQDPYVKNLVLSWNGEGTYDGYIIDYGPLFSNFQNETMGGSQRFYAGETYLFPGGNCFQIDTSEPYDSGDLASIS